MSPKELNQSQMRATSYTSDASDGLHSAGSDTQILAIDAIAGELNRPRYPDEWTGVLLGSPALGALHPLRLAIKILRKNHRRDRKLQQHLTAKSLGDAAALLVEKLAKPGAKDERTALMASLRVDALPSRGESGGERTLTGFMAAKSRPLHPVHAYAVVDYLVRSGFLPLLTPMGHVDGQAEVELFRALASFFSVSDRTHKYSASEFGGDYFVYRKSVHWPGRYVKASLNVEVLAGNGDYALRTREVHRHLGNDGSAPAKETYIGVMSKKSGYPFILSCLTSPKRPRNAPRFTLVHSIVFDGEDDKIQSMTGITVSPYGEGHAWASTVCFERATSPIADDDLGIYASTDKDNVDRLRIPESVRARLERKTSDLGVVT